AWMRSAMVVASCGGASLRPISSIASGKPTCACTSMVFTRLPFTTTSRRRGACAWAVAPMSAQPVKNTNSLRVVIYPPPSLLGAEPARYSDSHDIETHTTRGHWKRRAGTLARAVRRPGTEREPRRRRSQRCNDRSLGVPALPGPNLERARRRQAAVPLRAAGGGRASSHRAVCRAARGLRPGPRRLGGGAARAAPQAGRHLG